MNIYIPTHIREHVLDASELFHDQVSILHRYYQVQCSCGLDKQRLLISNLKSVVAVCPECYERIVIYDLAYYPTANKPKLEETFSPLVEQCDASSIYVCYEYGPPEEDVPFDPNDITWCQVYIIDENDDLVKVFDDETS